MNITKEYYYNIHTLIDIPFMFLTFIFWIGLCSLNARKLLKNQSTGDKLYRIKQKNSFVNGICV